MRVRLFQAILTYPLAPYRPTTFSGVYVKWKKKKKNTYDLILRNNLLLTSYLKPKINQSRPKSSTFKHIPIF